MMVGVGGSLVLGVVIGADDHVRSRLLGLVSGGAGDELAGATLQFHHAMRVVNETIPFDGVAHSTVGVFVVAALVLLAMMLKV
jgi:hypothetical protein